MEILRIGSRGPNVEALQLALFRAGYQPGPIDGIFGGKTQSAVIGFQSDRGLTPDGIVGPVTLSSLLPYLRGYTVHTIASGDTLYMLAKQYKTTLHSILIANPSVNPMQLAVGSQIIVPFLFPVVPTVIRYSGFLVEQLINGLSHRYPFIDEFTIGNSAMGQPLRGTKVGQGSTEVFYNASHHANEWINTPVLLKFLEEYAFAYANGLTIFGLNARALYAKTTLYMVPLVNPDGVDLVTGAISPGSPAYLQAQRLAANYPDIPFPDGWKANLHGVDLNLNYPAGWENAKWIKYAQGYTQPGPRDFVGLAALSEPESSAMHSFTLSRSFTLTISYHTQGEEIYWKYLDMQPSGAKEIGQAFAATSGYSLVDTPYESGFAGYKDWFILQYNQPGYTIEAGTGTNPLPLSAFEQIYRDNLGILALGLQMA